MNEIRDAAVDWALEKVGWTANPSDLYYEAFRDLIGPAEQLFRAEGMLKESTCGLFAAAFLRHLCRRTPPRLVPPYHDGHAMANIANTALEAGSERPPNHEPLPGDIVHLGGTSEHLYIVVASMPLLYGGSSVESIDGGQVDGEGHQCIRKRSRILSPTGAGNGTIDDEFSYTPGGFAMKRPVLAIYDLEALVSFYG